MTDINIDEAPHIVASTFNTVAAGTEVILQVNLAKPHFDGDKLGDVAFEPQVYLHMSPQAAKELMILLKGAIESYEGTFGVLRSPFIDERSKASA